ncbi:MAG: hypothetical protein ABIS47_10240 [Acidimicrobiales bacterium]
MGYLVGVGPGHEGELDAARTGGIVDGAAVLAPQVPMPGICHAVDSPNTETARCGSPVARVLDQSYPAFVGLEHCVTCDAALAEEGEI